MKGHIPYVKNAKADISEVKVFDADEVVNVSLTDLNRVGPVCILPAGNHYGSTKFGFTKNHRPIHHPTRDIRVVVGNIIGVVRFLPVRQPGGIFREQVFPTRK